MNESSERSIRPTRRHLLLALAAVTIGLAIWLRLGTTPDAGSHRVKIIEVEGSAPVDVSLGARHPLYTTYFSTIGDEIRPDGFIRRARAGAPISFSGPMRAHDELFWRVGPEGGSFSVEVDGEVVAQIDTDQPEFGFVPLDFPVRIPRTSLLLLAVSIGWGAAIAVFATRLWRNNPFAESLRRVGLLVAGVTVAIALTAVLRPPAPTSSARFDITVQPLEGASVATGITNSNGELLLGPELTSSSGWVYKDSRVRSITESPQHWSTALRPVDRLVVEVEVGSALVNVNGREIVVDAGSDIDTRVDHLGPAVGLPDRILPTLSVAATLVLRALVFGLMIVAVGSLVGWWRRRSTTEPASAPANDAQRSTLRDVIRFGAFPVAVWCTWLVILWPGMVNPDATSQIIDNKRGLLSDWHPYPVTLAFTLANDIGGGPWLMLLIMASATALCTGLACTWAVRAGARRPLAYATGALVALAPITSIMTVSLWKDVVMGIGVLAFTLAIWRLSETNSRDRPINRRVLGFAIIAGLAVWLSRHNGFPIVLAPMFTLLLLRPAARRITGIALVVIVGAALLVRGPLLSVSNATPSPVASIAYVQRISAHLEAGTELEPDEIEFLEQYRSVEEYWPYNCATVQVSWANSFAIPLYDYASDEAELRSLWLRLAARNPSAELDHIACSSQILWDPFDNGSYTYFLDGSTATGHADVIRATRTLDLAIEAHPNRDLARRLFDTFTELPAPLIRPAIPTALLFAAALAAAGRRRSWTPLLIASPAVAQTLTLIPFSLVQDTRFQYGTVLVATVATPFLIAAALFPKRWVSLEEREPADSERGDAADEGRELLEAE